MRNFIVSIVSGLLVAGCAIGNTHRYDLGDAALDVKTEKIVAATVVDVRSEVVSGDKTPDFSGVQRGGFGNPFDITTDSGNPLVDDMTTSIVKSLSAADINARGVPVPPKSSVSAAREQLLAADAERFLLLILAKWNSDTYANTGLTFDMSLSVLQKDGTVTAEKEIRGHDNLGASFVPADARVNTEKAFRQKLEQLFGDPAIRSALE